MGSRKGSSLFQRPTKIVDDPAPRSLTMHNDELKELQKMLNGRTGRQLEATIFGRKSETHRHCL